MGLMNPPLPSLSIDRSGKDSTELWAPPFSSLLCLAACPSTSNIGSGVRVETAADEETKPKQSTH
jgi:hypothetical protein